MKNLKKFVKNYLKDEDGQTMVEYVLLLAVAAAIIFKLRTQIDTRLGGVITKVFDKVGAMTDEL